MGADARRIGSLLYGYLPKAVVCFTTVSLL